MLLKRNKRMLKIKNLYIYFGNRKLTDSESGFFLCSSDRNFLPSESDG